MPTKKAFAYQHLRARRLGIYDSRPTRRSGIIHLCFYYTISARVNKVFHMRLLAFPITAR